MQNENRDEFRKMPSNIDAEERTLSACLLGEAKRACDYIIHGDFYLEKHQLIFETIERMVADGDPVELVTLRSRLDAEGKIEKAGGAVFLAKLTDEVPLAGNVPHFCKLIRQAAQRREIIRRANDAIMAAFDEPDHEAVISIAHNAFHGIDDASGPGDSITFAELAEKMPEHWERLQGKNGEIGVPTGFKDLDGRIGGMQAPDLIILAARPAMGKTALALNMGENTARAGYPVGIVSLEMTPEQLFERATAKTARVDSHRLRCGEITSGQWGSIVNAMGDLSGLPITISKKPKSTLFEITGWIRRQHRENGIRLAIVDYLQLSHGDDRTRRRDLDIADITRGLKNLALDLGIPVLLLSQLNRKVEERSDRRPMLSDLRESGAIEQDADLVLFIYRDEVYNKNSADRGVAEIIIAKHRNGPTGTVKLAWIGWRTTFENLAR